MTFSNWRRTASRANLPSRASATPFADIKMFELFVGYLKQKGIKITIWLIPYHPFVYGYLEDSEKYHAVLEAEEYFQKYAAKNKITLIGSYNPDKLGLGKEHFYDGHHIKFSGIEKIIDSTRKKYQPN